MPYRVGDHVFILKGGYGAQGLRNGDIGVVIALSHNNRIRVAGLAGTEAASLYGDGLTFFTSELCPANTSQTTEESKTMIDAEGKYFWTKSGWLFGPMRVTNGFGIKRFVFNDYRFDVETLTCLSGSSHDLIPEAVDPGEGETVSNPPLGSCIKYNEKFFWVTRKDGSELFLQNADDSYWLYGHYSYNVYPNLFAKTSQAVDLNTFKDKWVWSIEDKEYYKVKSVDLTFQNGRDGFTQYARMTPPGYSWHHTRTVDVLDLTKVLDKHPLEETMVRAIQGEGKYLYAKSSKGKYALMFPSGYRDEYYIFCVDERDYQLSDMRTESNAWWHYQAFRADTLPFELPFSVELCEASARTHVDEGCNTLQEWLIRHAPEAIMPAIWHRAKLASNTRGNIALYLNEKQMESQKIQSLRPGRALRVLLPKITDAELEKLVDKFRKDFPMGDYTVHRSFEAEAFKKAYSGAITAMQNPSTTYARKSLANSCMRHDFSHLKHHPAEAYASGEFEMLWTETPDGKIGSRMVVWHPPAGHRKHGTIQCGPVYGTCEYSMDLLQELMVKEGAALFNDATWCGAKLSKLHKSSNEVFVPYIDNEQGLLVHDDCLEITDEDPDDCECSARNTCGYSYISTARCSCDRCGDRMDEDDSYHTPDGLVCEYCYSDYYFTCEEYDEVYHNDEATTVYSMRSWGVESRTVCCAARDEFYVYCADGEYWHQDDVLALADGTYLGGNAHAEAAECMMTNEYYLLDDLIPTVGGDYVSKDYYNNHKGEFTMNADGELEQLEEAA